MGATKTTSYYFNETENRHNMMRIRGIYDNGKIQLYDPINFNCPCPIEIEIIFLQSDQQSPKLNPSDFSFFKSLALITQGINGGLSELVVEERRNEKW